MNSTATFEILKEGNIVRTRIGSGIAWYENIIYKSQNDTITLSCINSYIENAVMPGSNIWIKVTNEFFEYVFESHVLEINLQFPSHIIVQVIKAEEMINTRSFPRYDVYLPSNIRPLWSEDSFYSVITNICLGGMAFYSKHDFDYGEESELNIYLPNNKTVSAKGKTIRKNVKQNFVDYSMQFICMDETNSSILAEFLTTIEEKWDSMQNDFFNNIKKSII